MSASSNAGTDSKDSNKNDTKVEKKKTEEEELIKSENDSMEYRLIHLENGMKVILVSDVLHIVDLNALSDPSGERSDESGEESGSDTCDEAQNDDESEEDDSGGTKHTVKEGQEKFAACSLYVGVGGFSDPLDIPGLAHFVEHMVFMGSTKYPEENGFDGFITKHGGSDNGATESEGTLFYFECHEKHLKEGIDRFAQFFISPLMKREAITREREIVHSEFELSQAIDEIRREHILGSLAPPGHPAGKFLWGNMTSLATNVDDDVLYERVHEFRKRHYSAHRMTAAVQGRLPLDTLEEYVRSSFSEIPSNYLEPEDFSKFVGTFGTPDRFNKIIWVKPVRNTCQVYLTWILPSYLKEYKSKPLNYVGWFLGHEGDGSLLSLLRKKVWALECDAGNEETGFELNSIYSLFSVVLSLTEEGFKHINEVVSLVFSYIAMLKENSPNQEGYDELQKICATNFRYKAEIPASSCVEILAEALQLYEPKHYLSGGDLYFEYRPDLIMEILNKLTPDNVNLLIYSKEIRDSFYDRVEPWFQTKHKIDDIPPEWIKNWHSAVALEELHLPRPNPYLTNDFSLLKEPETNPPYPEKILETDLIKLWYRQDVKFKQPFAYYSFYIMSTIMSSDPLNSVLLSMLTMFFETKFTESVFAANEAGLNCNYTSVDCGLSLSFHGYNEKLPVLFDEILKLIYKCCTEIKDESNRELFEAIKTDRSQSYYNKSLKPKKLVKMARLSLLVEQAWTAVEYLDVMDRVTLETLHDFATKFFSSVKIFGLIQGNISKELSLELCEKFQSVLKCSPLVGERPQFKVAKIRPGETFLRLKSFSEFDSNSVVLNYYQVGPTCVKTACMLDLLMVLMDEPLFDSLRTKQRVGYEVHCVLRDTFGILGFSILVCFQWQKFHADEVNDKIEAFLQSFLIMLKGMSKKEWEEMKESLILLKSTADLHIQDEVKRNFSEIVSNEFKFDRIQKELEMIPQITHRELCNWYADLIMSGKNFRKLSIQVIGGTTGKSSPSSQEDLSEKKIKLVTMTSDNEKRDLFITDLEAYKSTREFYPTKKVLS